MFQSGKRSWRPRHKVRERRRKLLMWKIGGAVAAFLLLVGGLAFASHHSSITVQEIIVSGNETILDDELRDTLFKRLEGRYGFLFARSNILLYPHDTLVASVLNTYPRIKEAQVDTKNLHTIELSVSEREPVALWCGQSMERAIDPCYFLDEEGFIFTVAPSFTDAFYFTYFGVVEGEPLGAHYLSPEEFQNIERFISLFSHIDLTPTSFELQQDTDAHVILRSGSRIYINREDDLPETFERLESVMTADAFDPETQVDYIDLRFGNKVYYTVQ